MDRLERIAAFFTAYEDKYNRAMRGEDVEPREAAADFTSCFLAADPSGVSCGMNDEKFLEVIPRGYAYYRDAGIVSMKISGRHTELLDEFHAMCRVTWTAAYKKKDGAAGTICFPVIYLLRIAEGRCRIFGFISGDEQKALRETGLIA